MNLLHNTISAQSYNIKSNDPHLKITDTGITLIKYFEGLKLEAYKCCAGKWTIGYGHTGSVNNKLIDCNTKITANQAEELLISDLRKLEISLSKLINVPLQTYQFDSLMSLVFNIGITAFIKSTLLKLLNVGNYNAVPLEILQWDKIGQTQIPGLYRRRYVEMVLWVTQNLIINA